MNSKILLIIALLLPATQNIHAYDLVVGTNHYALVFENLAVSNSLSHFAFNDIQRCFLVWGTNTVVHEYSSGRRSIRATVYGSPYYRGDLSLLENQQMNRLDVPENLVATSNGQFALHVPSALLQKYSAAFAFRSNHLSQVQAADDFVAFVSSPEFANITSNQVSDYVLYKDASPELYLATANETIHDIMNTEFFPPSILGFYYDSRGPSATNLWVRIPVSSRNKSLGQSYDVLPSIWHEGKWKLCFWDMRME